MTTAAAIWLALTLAVSAGLKSWRYERSAAALQTYGVSGAVPQRLALGGLITTELALAAMLALREPWAAAAAGGLFATFAAVTSIALASGRKGRPCACFGSQSRLGWSSPARALAPAALAALLALGWLPRAPSSYDSWLTVGLTLALAVLAALGIAVFALAREVGVLRLGMAGRGALEIPHEGPQLGSAQAWAGAIHAEPRALLRLAVFSSPGCPLCSQVAPAVQHVAADPLLAVRTFDEEADPAAWSQAQVPGSPYAVALGLDGVVMAKGTFNSLGQLESIVGTARRRQQELPVAA